MDAGAISHEKQQNAYVKKRKKKNLALCTQR
jgi:hypothetical protein